MTPVSPGFDSLYETCVKILDDNGLIYLATADDSRVRVRVVDYANIGLRLGFITWPHTVKMEHLKLNPRVSLCVANLQIEGVASAAGHPGLAEHEELMRIYRDRHQVPYHNFIAMDDVELITVEFALAVIMTYEDGYLYLDHLDLAQSRAFRQKLSPWNPDIPK